MNKFILKPQFQNNNFILWHNEFRAMLRLALPLTLNKLSYMAIITTDVIMMGWLGPEALAAGGLAGQFYSFIILFSIGLVSALSPVFAQHLGARRFRNVRQAFRQGVWIAFLSSIPCILIIWQGGSIFVLLGQDAELSEAAQSYLRFLVLGLIPGLWRLVMSVLLAAHHRPRANLVITIAGIGLNILANYALMFGNFGFPKLGLIGAGISSALVTSFMFLSLLAFVATDRRMRRYHLFSRLWRSNWSQFFEISRIGFPIAVTDMLELSLFFAASLFIGLQGKEALSAHAVAMTSCALFFMIAMGIAHAATVRVGYAIGAENPLAAIRTGWIALLLGLGFSLFPATIFLVFGSTIVSIFLDVSRSDIVPTSLLAVSFLGIGALFQIVDFAQVIIRGVLQGMKDTRRPLIIAIITYWGIGIPLMAFFSLYLNMEGQSIWISFVIALAIMSLLLFLRLRRQFRQLLLSA